MPKAPIRISVEQLRIAAKQGRRAVVPCHPEMMAVMEAIEAVYAKGDVTCHVSQIHKYLMASDKCIEDAKAERKLRKPSTLYFLTKYLDQNKGKKTK